MSEATPGESVSGREAVGDALSGACLSPEARASGAFSSEAQSGEPQPGDLHSGEAQSGEVQSGEAQPIGARAGASDACNAHAGEATSGEGQLNEAFIGEAQCSEVRPADASSGGGPSGEAPSDRALTDRALTDRGLADRVLAGGTMSARQPGDAPPAAAPPLCGAQSGAVAAEEAAPAIARVAQDMLGHVFARPDLLDEALTHRSAAQARSRARPRGRRGAPGSGSNERLEFIGDRVLGLVVAEWLAERFPDEQEGELGPRYAHLVSRTALSGIAAEIGLSELLAVAANEDRTGVRRLATVLADALEALIGALYLDGGLEAARRFVRRTWQALMEAQVRPPKDPKTSLQAWALGRGLRLPCYATEQQSGPSHNPQFTVAVTVGGITGRGTAGSKRVAERLAAADVLARLAVAPHPAQVR